MTKEHELFLKRRNALIEAAIEYVRIVEKESDSIAVAMHMRTAYNNLKQTVSEYERLPDVHT